MAIIKYTVPAGTIEFKYPTLTITRQNVMSATKQAITSVRQVYSVRAVLQPNDGETLDDAINRYETILSVAGGELVIQDPQYSADVSVKAEDDLERGPLPVSIDITRIHGGRIALLQWQILTVRFPGEWINEEANKWIDWVYTIRTDIDSNFYATRRISGFVKLNPNHPDFDKRTADAFRDTVMGKDTENFPIPTYPNGLWQRVHSDWAVSADLATLGFSIVDRQLYSFLPAGALDGNIMVETTSKRNGVGAFDLSGWMVGSANKARGDMQAICQEMMESFYNLVCVAVYENSGQKISISTDHASFRHTLRSNRVDFRVHWTLYGYTAGMNLAIKLSYTATRAANWLALITSLTFDTPPEDLGPYGSAQACGINEAIAPIILIDWSDKEVVPPVPNPGNDNPPEGGELPADQETGEPATKHHFFTQRHQFIVKSHNYTVPGVTNATVIETRPAEVFLIVSGEMERPEADLTIPIPPFPLVTPAELVVWGSTPCATPIRWSVTPISPTVDGDYRISWDYVLQLHNMAQYIANGAFNYVPWPYSPLLPEGPEGNGWENHLGRSAIVVDYPLTGGSWY